MRSFNAGLFVRPELDVGRQLSVMCFIHMVPPYFASGAGAEIRRSVGTAMLWGAFGVTLFGLFLTPVLFYVISGFLRGRAPVREPAAVAADGSSGARGVAMPAPSAVSHVARRRADRTGRTVLRLTSSDRAHTMVILKSSVSDRLGAPRAGALAGWSDRGVHRCLNLWT